ncbi:MULTISPECIES: DUF72 domain-containing protein [Ramlibacter]|uniref:DUF72 domain-containing protein n=1 Tax=Ramlibacter pinisoli TaxID=2682844 RepID=A0A6N8J0I2_9BURK|nr:MULTISPECIES: DUF72 domain-containing protein [Ramlibacter]MBA2962858.1 DUF72 domain-containing protein [Ramlibacter sp. CGMCC 1.13660]MVQ32801.1 DUF72 domain-containing protein [Ramlibacter pinisoli]
MTAPRVRVGIGGWTFEPWRGTFYPPGLPHQRELHHASRVLTAIEVNGTFYSTFTPATYGRWRDETPDGFVFTLKAHRSITVRRELAGAGDAIARFLGSGVSELGPKLGPIVWQFQPTKRFEPADFEAFLALLPSSVDGLALRHVLEVRHASFADPAYLALARRHGCVTVHTDSPKYLQLEDAQAPFAYLRLMRSESDQPTGYAPAALDAWAAGARAWSSGPQARDAFVFFINGAKERAPAAAQALLQRLGSEALAPS